MALISVSRLRHVLIKLLLINWWEADLIFDCPDALEESLEDVRLQFHLFERV